MSTVAEEAATIFKTSISPDIDTFSYFRSVIEYVAPTLSTANLNHTITFIQVICVKVDSLRHAWVGPLFQLMVNLKLQKLWHSVCLQLNSFTQSVLFI